MTPIQKVVWTKNASPREQLVMLRLMDVYGTRCEVTVDEMSAAISINKPTLVKTLRGLKELGWVKSERVYKDRGDKRLKALTGNLYHFTV
jgi:DNA-binding MarR family transcriptional regulator